MDNIEEQERQKLIDSLLDFSNFTGNQPTMAYMAIPQYFPTTGELTQHGPIVSGFRNGVAGGDMARAVKLAALKRATEGGYNDTGIDEQTAEIMRYNPEAIPGGVQNAVALSPEMPDIGLRQMQINSPDEFNKALVQGYDNELAERQESARRWTANNMDRPEEGWQKWLYDMAGAVGSGAGQMPVNMLLSTGGGLVGGPLGALAGSGIAGLMGAKRESEREWGNVYQRLLDKGYSEQEAFEIANRAGNAFTAGTVGMNALENALTWGITPFLPTGTSELGRLALRGAGALGNAALNGLEEVGQNAISNYYTGEPLVGADSLYEGAIAAGTSALTGTAASAVGSLAHRAKNGTLGDIPADTRAAINDAGKVASKAGDVVGSTVNPNYGLQVSDALRNSAETFRRGIEQQARGISPNFQGSRARVVSRFATQFLADCADKYGVTPEEAFNVLLQGAGEGKVITDGNGRPYVQQGHVDFNNADGLTQSVIKIFDAGDVDALIHETGHVGTELMIKLAETGNEAARADLAALQDEAGVSSYLFDMDRTFQRKGLPSNGAVRELQEFAANKLVQSIRDGEPEKGPLRGAMLRLQGMVRKATDGREALNVQNMRLETGSEGYDLFGGVKAAERIDQAKGNTELMDNLSKAQQAEQHGMGVREIWQRFGWYHDKADDKWRFEMPRPKINLKAEPRVISKTGLEKMGVDISRLWNLPESMFYVRFKDLVESDFLAGYPEHENAVVIFSKTPSGSDGYTYDASGTPVIVINKRYLHKTSKGEMRLRSLNGALERITYHEIQHGTEKPEGFAKGGEPDMFTRIFTRNAAEKLYYGMNGEVWARNAAMRDADLRVVWENRLGRLLTEEEFRNVLRNTSPDESERWTFPPDFPYQKFDSPSYGLGEASEVWRRMAADLGVPEESGYKGGKIPQEILDWRKQQQNL